MSSLAASAGLAPSGAPAAPRGRARSHSMHEDTHEELLDDLDALNASIDGTALPSSSDATGAHRTRNPTGEPAAGGAAKQKPALSKKTINMLSDLSAAVKNTPPELEHTTEHVLTEEELAERELAEQERHRRTAELGAKDGAGAGGSAAASGGGAPPASSVNSSVLPSVVSAAARKPGRRKGEETEFDLLVKLLLLGDAGVGKTSLMLRYADDKFSTSLLSTAGVDYKAQLLDIDGKTVKCQIWDTAGQQRFHVITQAYYKSAHGIVLVFDVSDESSFMNVRYWMENITKHANPHSVRTLVGNKIDSKSRKIDSAKGKALADEFHMTYFETSAKDGTGVREAFHSTARSAARNLLETEGAPGVKDSKSTVKQLNGGKEAGAKKDCVIQ